MPDTPDVPDTPNVPDTPDVPDTPNVPGSSEEEECQHQFGRWFVIEPATEEKAGVKTHICELCGYEETEEFSVEDMDSNEDSNTDGDSADSDVSDSGEDSADDSAPLGVAMSCQSVVGLPMLGLGLAVLAAGALLIKRKED